VVERVREPGGHCYQLTAAGRELDQVVLALGTWGQRWNRSRLARDELDVELLMLDLARNLDTDAFALDSAVIAVQLSDLRGPSRYWWLLVDDDEVDLCSQHPGRPVDVALSSTLRMLTKVWRGDVSASAARRAGGLTIEGPKAVARRIDEWLGVSLLAHVGPA
jgi:hypothetical protein